MTVQSQQGIPVEKVTKPIQLLAAWLAGLVLIDSAFLISAANIDSVPWIPSALVVAAIVNVPLFLLSIFLLQTRFRPEMQEDAFYSKYLETKTGTVLHPITEPQLNRVKEEMYAASTQTIAIISELQKEIEILKESTGRDQESAQSASINSRIVAATNSFSWNQFRIRLNNHLTDATQFKKALITNSIPIHGVFGAPGGGFQDPPCIVIGSGFDIEHLRKFINAISELEIANLAFAYPEQDEPDMDYEREILIGAYNHHDYGLTLQEAIELVKLQDITAEVFYSAIRC